MKLYFSIRRLTLWPYGPSRACSRFEHNWVAKLVNQLYVLDAGGGWLRFPILRARDFFYFRSPHYQCSGLRGYCKILQRTTHAFIRMDLSKDKLREVLTIGSSVTWTTHVIRSCCASACTYFIPKLLIFSSLAIHLLPFHTVIVRCQLDPWHYELLFPYS